MTVSYKESLKHKPLHEYEPLPYDVMTNEELDKGNYDPETIKTIRELEHNAHTSTGSTTNGTVMREAKMPTLKEAAEIYEPKITKNIADLSEVDITAMNLEDREGTDNNGEKFQYKVIVVNNEEYRVPGSVIGDIHGILTKNPNLKRVSVSKSGSGMATRYQVTGVE